MALVNIRRRRWIVSSLLAFFLFLAISVLFYMRSSGLQFLRSYKQLELGMSKHDVEELFDAKPYFECSLDSSTVWYFSRPLSFFDGVLIADPNSHYTSPKDLPQPYASVILAFTPDEKLHAFTWIGETNTIETLQGSFEGTDLSTLSLEELGGDISNDAEQDAAGNPLPAE